MCLVVSCEDFFELLLLCLWVVYHDRINEGDLIVSKIPSVLWPLIQTSCYELCETDKNMNEDHTDFNSV